MIGAGGDTGEVGGEDGSADVAESSKELVVETGEDDSSFNERCRVVGVGRDVRLSSLKSTSTQLTMSDGTVRFLDLALRAGGILLKGV